MNARAILSGIQKSWAAAHASSMRTVIAAACIIISSVQGAQPPDPPPHATVGQRLIPADVDWANLVYKTDFDDASGLKDWQLEGGKRVSIQNGKLVLESEPGERSNHLVCWLKTEAPADFLLEFSVKPLTRKEGLNIIFFSTRGHQGESIFDPALKSRHGVFRQYHSSDLNGYHISYWAGDRSTANVRKNAGFKLVATGPDLVWGAPEGSFQVIRVYKRGGTVRLMVDDIISVAFDDGDKAHGPAWTHSGWIGLRQMGHTVRCEYDYLRVYPLRSE